jgi:hypothetical protein
MPFAPPGAIANASIDDGWIWGIPLHDGTMSVGVVRHKSAFQDSRADASLEESYLAAVRRSPLMSDLLASARLVSPIKVEQDYSYMAESLAGPGFFQAGDAACFIDPLLSTGVHLAMHSAVLAAASVLSLVRGEVLERDAIAFYEESYRKAFLRLAVVVSGMYQLYDGNQTYFWTAQQLTDRDYDDEESMKDAFLHVVSGLEDRTDSAYSADKERLVRSGMSEEEAARTQFMHQAYNQAFFLSSLSSPIPAVAGRDGTRLAVTLTPRLGLAAVDQGPLVTADR